MALALIALCGVALIGLLYAEKIQRARLKYVCKPLCSACFVALAALRGEADTALDGSDRLILLGLVLGAVGDVCLMLDSKAWFKAGLASFLLGHVLYAVAFVLRAPLSWPHVPAGVVAAVGAAALLGWLWPHLGRLRAPVTLYVAAIAAMVAAGVSVLLAGRAGGALVAVAVLLFAVSDVAVARQRFVAPSFANKAWGLPTYYAAQLLLALSIAG
jgi:uncharacterized membrane protein YhhN